MWNGKREYDSPKWLNLNPDDWNDTELFFSSQSFVLRQECHTPCVPTRDTVCLDSGVFILDPVRVYVSTTFGIPRSSKTEFSNKNRGEQ